MTASRTFNSVRVVSGLRRLVIRPHPDQCSDPSGGSSTDRSKSLFVARLNQPLATCGGDRLMGGFHHRLAVEAEIQITEQWECTGAQEYRPVVQRSWSGVQYVG